MPLCCQVKVDRGDSTDLSSAMADVGTEKGIATATVHLPKDYWHRADTPGAQ